MRIVGGAFKGRPLAAPRGRATRPTSDRAREAVFNILAHAPWAPPLDGARVIDLFAGSGALGFEALSRGAAFCLFVETDAAARGAVRENAERLDVLGAVRVHRRDAAELGAKPAGLGPPFDLAFLDPPYRQGLAPRALARLRAGGWLAPDALLLVETAEEEDALELSEFETVDARRYGPARVSFLKRTG
ncbi:MAG: 16S rRNA (guanine(966)-N(2))-methyltransferase RsmD [Caulobacterales bacterium]|nr:16S rRNA (guanine(966)-N(2))-methyltransferase RsmD [Caulobacterales bacterium]